MRALFYSSVVSLAFVASLGLFHYTRSSTSDESLNHGYTFVEVTEPVSAFARDPLNTWKRPTGPPRVALQVGHWKNQELPDEFENLRRTGGGASGGGHAEWEVNLAIAELTADLLRAEGVTVELLPATIPPDYWADALVSIHADGNLDSAVSGYKVAAPRRDQTGKAELLADYIEDSYGQTVPLALDPNVSRNMRGYYAFNWRRYEHSMHPMTVGTIVETGFLTNPSDRQIIVSNPAQAALGIAEGILAYLQSQDLLKKPA